MDERLEHTHDQTLQEAQSEDCYASNSSTPLDCALAGIEPRGG